MKEIQKQSLYNSIVAYLGILLGYVNMGILFPFILTPDQIGLYSVIAAIGNVASNMVKYGLPNLVVRYMPFFRDDQQKKASFMGFGVLIIAVGSAAFMLLYFLLSDVMVSRYSGQSALFPEYEHLVVPFTLFMLLFELFYNFCRAHFYTVAATIAKDLLFRIIIFMLIISYHLQWIDFEVFIWIYACVYAIPSAFLMAYLIIKKEMAVSFKLGELINLKEMLVYGGFVSLASLSSVLINDLDKIMLTDYIGLSATGIYTIAAFFGSVIVAPARSMRMITGPVIAQLMKDGAMENIERIYRKSSINLLAIGVLLMVGLFINLHNIFRILPPVYAGGYYVIIYIGLSKLVEMGTGANAEILTNSRYFRYDLFFNVGLAALAVLTNMTFIPMMGIEGAALATALSIFLFQITKSLFIYIKLKIHPFSVKTIHCLLLGLLVMGVDQFIPQMDSLVLDLTVRSVLAMVIYLPALFYFNISPDINEMVSRLLEMVNKRK